MIKVLFLFVSLSALATDSIHFFNIKVTPEPGGLAIEIEPEKMLAYDLLKNEAYDLEKAQYDHTLDGPFRQTAFLLRTMERNRGTLLAEPDSSLPVLNFVFELAVREATGEPIEELEYPVSVGLAAEPGMGMIRVGETGVSHTFPIGNINEPKAYMAFVQKLVFPYGKKLMKQPRNDEYLVDLYYKWPRVLVEKKQFNVFDLFPSLLTWDKDIARKLRIYVGSTWCFKDDQGNHQQVQSGHLRTYKESIEAYTKVLELENEGDTYEVIAALEEYVALVPGDKKALKKLMDYYLEDHMNSEAYNLITRFQPFFATIKGGLPNQKALAARAERRRNWLLGLKSSFEKNESVLLKITAPSDGDLVTGSTELNFSLAGSDSPVLEVECYLKDQLIAKMQQPPYKATFTVDGVYGNADVRVVAYFEDETYQEDTIRVRTLKVDAQESVNLVGVRASIFQKNTQGRVLEQDDFRISENGQMRDIANFRKDTAPLRVAILLDTSISMVGPKLHRAQYAVKTFLSKLAPEDRVSIYSFDNKVIKLTDFTNDYKGITPSLMTLSTQVSTSLYDGMLIAHDALLGQNGTKVMIIISDGDDSSSATTDIHVASVLRSSPVMVYSIILPGGVFQDSDQGERFLKQMADLSGSISIRLKKVDRLSSTFDRLYQDLKSFYYMDYYTQIPNRDQRDVEVTIKGVKGKVRSRMIN